MRTKIIKLCSVSLISLGMSTGVYAIAAGMYFGGQIGRSNTHNKPITVQTVSNPKTFTGTIDPLTGIAPSFTTGTLGTQTINPSNTGIGGRLYFGYNFNPFFALEGGFTHYAQATYTVPSSPPLAVGNPTGNPKATPGVSENGFDFVARGIAPIGATGFGAFGKVGFAIIKRSAAGTVSDSYASPPGTPAGVYDSRGIIVTASNAAQTNFRPTASVGFSYDFTQSWQAELTLARVFGGGNMQNADLYSLGVSYHIVDKYCGQFLC
jgi:hypothetical protein